MTEQMTGLLLKQYQISLRVIQSPSWHFFPSYFCMQVSFFIQKQHRSSTELGSFVQFSFISLTFGSLPENSVTINFFSFAHYNINNYKKIKRSQKVLGDHSCLIFSVLKMMKLRRKVKSTQKSEVYVEKSSDLSETESFITGEVSRA